MPIALYTIEVEDSRFNATIQSSQTGLVAHPDESWVCYLAFTPSFTLIIIFLTLLP